MRELRAITRRIQALTVERAREKNRLHAHQASQMTSAIVTNDIEVNLRHLTRRIAELVRQAMKLLLCRSATSVTYIAVPTTAMRPSASQPEKK